MTEKLPLTRTLNGRALAHATTVVTNALLEGKGARTVLASPLTATVCAVTGELTDPRTFVRQEAERHVA